MRDLDRRAVEFYGLPDVVLMENAGRALWEASAGLSKKPAALFCGKGNNGGDGLAAARYFLNEGRDVRLVLAQGPDFFTGAAAVHWKPLLRMGARRRVFQNREKLLEFVSGAGLVVDALLGTGLRPPLREPYFSLIGLINSLGLPTVSADIPSGLDGDRGIPLGEVVRADVTVTMGLPKKGLVFPSAKKWVGRLVVADIGYPRPLIRPYIGNGGG